MICAKTNETLIIMDRTGHLKKQSEAFKFLGSVMNARGGCEQDQGSLAKYLKGKVYKTTLADPELQKPNF